MNTLQATGLSERDLITNILNSFFIVSANKVCYTVWNEAKETLSGYYFPGK